MPHESLITRALDVLATAKPEEAAKIEYCVDQLLYRERDPEDEAGLVVTLARLAPPTRKG